MVSFFDGTGSESVFGPLAPGRYKLVLWYSVPLQPKEAKKNDDDPARWVGDVVTREVLVEVSENPTQEVAAGPDLAVADFPEPLRIVESKPVTANGAMFVIAAQAQWRPGEPGKTVPIEIQLRIANISKDDFVFPTFDTFFVTMTDANGNKLSPRDGRKLTRFTRPVLIPGGAAFSLGREGGEGRTARRHAELYCDEKTMKSEFRYFDGTGMGSRFEALEPGRYKLAFAYMVAPAKRGAKGGGANMWSGGVFTEEITVELVKH